MSEQSESFKTQRDKIRQYLVMSKLGLKYQTYNKLMGQKVNGLKNAKLRPWEVEDVEKALCIVEQSIHEFRNELHRKD